MIWGIKIMKVIQIRQQGVHSDLRKRTSMRLTF